MARLMIGGMLFGILGIGILLWLGFWQLWRLQDKNAMLKNIGMRLAAEPILLSSVVKNFIPKDKNESVNQDDYNWLTVVFDANVTTREAHVLSSHKYKGPGYRVIRAARVAGLSEMILVDTGFILEGAKEALRPGQHIRISGNLLWPDEVDDFTPPPNLTRNIWFARDVAALGQYLNTAPILVVANSNIGNALGTEPVAVGHGIPNNHKHYAITWFSLAFVWFIMTLGLFWRMAQNHFRHI